MSLDKHRLYQVAAPASGVTPRKSPLVQGQPVVSQRTISASVPVTESYGSMSLSHAVDVRSSPRARPSTPPSASSISLTDATVSPRKNAPRQYGSPSRLLQSSVQPHAVDLTPSDEDSLPPLRLSSTRTEGFGSDTGAGSTEERHRSLLLADVSSQHEVLVQEALDAGLSSGEVPLSNQSVLSPAKVLRHIDDRSARVVPPVASPARSSLSSLGDGGGTVEAAQLSSVSPHPPNREGSKNASTTVYTELFPDAQSTPIQSQDGLQQAKLSVSSGSAESSISDSSKKKQKPKGRYVASRYMQSKPSAQPAATVARTRPVAAKPLPSSMSSRVSTRPVASKPKSSAPLSYKTPHALPADQLLLRARQATADSLFTPSLQIPGAVTRDAGAVSRSVHASAVKSAVAHGSRASAARKPPVSTTRETPSNSRAVRTPATRSEAAALAAVASTDRRESPRESVSGPPASDVITQRQLNCLYARTLQWAFLESKAKHCYLAQEKEAERWLYAMWQEVESLKRQEAHYLEQIASLEHSASIDSLLYSQLPGLQQISTLLPGLSETHKALSEALDTVHHQLPVRGFRLPQNLNLLVDAVSESEHLLGQLVSMASPSQDQLKQLAHLLSSLEETVSCEIDEVRLCARLVQQTARIQTSLTSLRLHLLQLERHQSVISH